MQVRSAYRTLAAKHHPDKHVATNVNNAELEFKRVCNHDLYNPVIYFSL
jgi:DnaJ-class molecular chaperone